MSGSLSFLNTSQLPPELANCQVASFRGLQFMMDRDGFSTNGEQRIAVHEYVFRDDATFEPMGRKYQTINIQGYLWTGNPDVYEQMLAFKKLCSDQQTPGELVTPVFGNFNCLVQNSGFAVDVNIVKFRITFLVVNNAKVSITQKIGTTQAGLQSAATDAQSSFQSFYQSAWASVKSVEGYAQQAIGTVNYFSNQVRGVVNDVNRVTGSIAGIDNLISPRFSAGRFLHGNLTGTNPVFSGINTALGTVAKANQAVNLARNAVTATGQAATQSTNLLNSLIGQLI